MFGAVPAIDTVEYLLQHLLSNSAKAFPDNVAVAGRDESMTYAELDQVSDRLAATLIERGVRRGDRVGIYMSKSVASIVSIHGILKAAAVYVPLDPNAPPARLAYVIEDCGIRCLLTSTSKAGAIARIFPEANPLDLVILTDNSGPPPDDLRCSVLSWAEVLRRPSAPDFDREPSIETDLAYILYTSGSTGVPKGVMISHLNSLTFVRWAHETMEVTSDDRVSNHAPLHFDLSIFDIFAAFRAGATVVPVPNGLSPFPVRLAEWIENSRISVWYSVPSVLSMMVLQGNLERFRFESLRTVAFAGEVFPVKYLRELMERIPHADYYNLFGPTETNVITYHKVGAIASDQTEPIPIGSACENTEVFALTDSGDVVKGPGQVGELYARGSCVAQGYWGDVEKTDRSFISHVEGQNRPGRAYRTGDLVTLGPDGEYRFLGRRDHMIKTRGYRVELGEIETVLYDHPEVEEAAVVGVPDELIGNRIKAFVVRNGSHAGRTELQSFCAMRLPKYMVPETIEFRESLPRTSTGKVDKPALTAS